MAWVARSPFTGELDASLHHWVVLTVIVTEFTTCPVNVSGTESMMRDYFLGVRDELV